MVNFNGVNFSDALYRNLSFNPYVGSIQIKWVMPLSNTVDGQTIGVNYRVINPVDGSIVIPWVKLQYSVNKLSTSIKGSISESFQILTNEQFPNTLLLEIEVPSFRRGNFPPELESSYALSFEGTQPNIVTPNNGMTNVSIGSLRFTDGVISTLITAEKNSTYPSAWNFNPLGIAWNIKNNETGSVVKSGLFPFTFGNASSYGQPFFSSGNTFSSGVLSLVIKDAGGIELSDTILVSLNDTTTPPPPPPPSGSNSYLIAVKAENGLTINGNVTPSDFSFLSDPDIGVSLYNGTITSSQYQEGVPALLTAKQVMDFLFSNLTGETPPPPPTSGDNFQLEFKINNGNVPNQFYVLDSIERDFVISNKPPCAELVNTLSTNETSQGFDFVIGQLYDLCDVGVPPPPEPDTCPIGYHKDPDTGLCVSDDTGDPLPEGDNTCFCLLYTDLSKTCHTLTNADYNEFVTNPIITGITAPVVVDIKSCNSTPQSLEDVRQEMLDNVNNTPNDTVSKEMIIQLPNNFRIENDRLLGDVKYIATNDFNSYWYNKSITSYMQVKTKFNQVLYIKQNALNFTEFERDEEIQFDESANGQDTLFVEFFVKPTGSQRDFTEVVQLTVKGDGQTDTTPKPPEGNLIKAMKGVLFGSIALTLLGSKK